MSKCKVNGCENKISAKRLCQKHYIRFLRHGDPNIIINPFRLSLYDKFWFYTKKGKPNKWWIWGGVKTRDGYGKVGHFGKEFSAHRLSFSLHFWGIPKNMWVLHKCDNPSCVNPYHLFLGTHDDNMKDMARKGRSTVGSRHGMSKLTEKDVIEIRKSHMRVIDLCKKFNVNRENIRLIKKRLAWKHI